MFFCMQHVLRDSLSKQFFATFALDKLLSMNLPPKLYTQQIILSLSIWFKCLIRWEKKNHGWQTNALAGWDWEKKLSPIEALTLHFKIVPLYGKPRRDERRKKIQRKKNAFSCQSTEKNVSVNIMYGAVDMHTIDATNENQPYTHSMHREATERTVTHAEAPFIRVPKGYITERNESTNNTTACRNARENQNNEMPV